MTKNFKVGDRVTCVDRGLSKYIQNGMEYVVTGLMGEPNENWVMVSVINDEGNEERYLACRFKKVEEEEKEMTYDFIKTKKSIKPNSTLYRLLKISNGLVHGCVHLSFDAGSDYMVLNSPSIEELINRLKAVKEILDSNN